MKKYILIFIAIVSLASCKKFLDETPKADLTSENFYKTDNDLELASIAQYNQINNAFNGGPGYGPVWGADDIMTTRNGNKITYADFDTFQANSSNDKMVWWGTFYGVIKSSNGILNNYMGSDISTEKKKAEVAGQAHFLRALSYFFLTRVWGEIPLILDNNIGYEKKKSGPAEIYAQILSDLEKAEAMLPDQWADKRRQNGVDLAPTKGSAKALLASVYLTMAGWPLKQTDKYALAAAKAKEVIDNKAKWGYDLLPNFADLWTMANRYNKETVFGCYYNVNTATVLGENSNRLCITFAPEDEGGFGVGYGEINFFNNFPAGPRKDATYQYNYFLNNNPANVVDYTQTLRKHPCFIKQRDGENYVWATHTIKGSNSRSVAVIRYADVLLTYAEAKAMSGVLDQSAYDAVNMVRKRAGLGNLAIGLSKEDFRDLVIAERGWEFAGAEPAARWFDLLRTETVAKANSNRNAIEEPFKGIPNDLTHAFYWAPIPANDQQLNPNL
ncbi:MAG: RagB/SusD family nutrient uptake outer membrane protein [Pedobacter sp.]